MQKQLRHVNTNTEFETINLISLYTHSHTEEQNEYSYLLKLD
jgi:hypothetical protein